MASSNAATTAVSVATMKKYHKQAMEQAAADAADKDAVLLPKITELTATVETLSAAVQKNTGDISGINDRIGTLESGTVNWADDDDLADILSAATGSGV